MDQLYTHYTWEAKIVRQMCKMYANGNTEGVFSQVHRVF